MSLLAIDEVTVRFGGVTAVDHASFEVEAGTVTGLIGPNGAGKTTCFNVINGLQRPTSGRVRLAGKDITRVAVHSRANRGMGRTFQRLEAFGSLSVRDNVRVALDIHGGLRGIFKSPSQRADELLDLVGILPYADERADSVPTGTARLLEVARALACEPRLLLLDEPSSGLDEQETHAFGRLLVDLAATDCTVLMVEHDMDLVMSVCDHLHVLDFGVVIASGSPEQVRADPVVQRAYLGYVDDAEGPTATAELEPATAEIPAVRVPPPPPPTQPRPSGGGVPR